MEGTTPTRIFTRPLEAWADTAFEEVIGGTATHRYVGLHDGRVLVQTHDDAPAGKVISVDLTSGDRVTVVVAEDPALPMAVMGGVECVDGHVVTVRTNVTHHVVEVTSLLSGESWPAPLRPGSPDARRNVDTVYTLLSPLFFITQAESQGYEPDCSLNSYMGPGSLLETAAPANQLDGSQGIGWIPLSDLSAAHTTGPVNDQEVHCATLMEDAGQDMTDAITKQVAMWICGAILFLDSAFEAAPEISPAGLAAGMRPDAGYQSPFTWRTEWGQGRRDGLGSYRMLAYDRGCRCFGYTSEEIAFR